jgi:hypothetical protein
MIDWKLEVSSWVLVSVVVRGLLVVMGAVLMVVWVDCAGGSVFVGFTGFVGAGGFSGPRLSPSKSLLMVWSRAVVPRSVASVVGSRVSWFLGGEQMNSESLLTLSQDEVIQGTE